MGTSPFPWSQLWSNTFRGCIRKWTHLSSALTATDLGDNTGPKMLSKSLMDGNFSILTSVADWSFPVVKVVGFKI